VWTEDDTEIAAGETATVALAVGTHTIVLTVTDDLGATGSDTVVVTVDPAPPPPPPPPDPGVHVGDLDGAAVNLPKGQWQAHVTVTVHDENEVAVSGAEVTFELGTGETVSCTTDGSGTCAVWSAAVKKKVGSVTFSVVSITSSSAYQPAQNHDPDGDSNGTTITVTKP
jgi:hypothetical protein